MTLASSRDFSLSFSCRIRSLISDCARWNLRSRSLSICFVALISRARWIQGPSVGRSTEVRGMEGGSTFDCFFEVVYELDEGSDCCG